MAAWSLTGKGFAGRDDPAALRTVGEAPDIPDPRPLYPEAVICPRHKPTKQKETDMNMISTVLKQLPGLKSSADFAAATATLEAEHATAQAAVATLEARREDTLFEGGRFDALEADIAAAEAQVRTLDVALTGARRRHSEATEAEAQAALEAAGKAAKKMNDKLRVEMIGFAQAAETLAAHADGIKTMRHKLREMKAALVAGGRGDFGPVDPIQEAIALSGRQVRDPLAGLQIPEFWPPHPDGPALLTLTK